MVIRAGVTAGWATVSRRSFRSGVRNKITTIASVLEGVIKSNPVTSQVLASPHRRLHTQYDLPDFVSESSSEVVGCIGATGNGRVQDNNSVQFWSSSIRIWEGGVSQKSVTFASGEADVISVVGAEGCEDGFPYSAV